MRQAAGVAYALTGHTLHLMVSSLDGHRSHLNRDRTAVYSKSGISKSFLVKNSTDRWRRRRDSCPASRGSHTVSTPCRFLESTAAVDRHPQRIPAMYRCRASTAPGVEYLSGLRL